MFWRRFSCAPAGRLRHLGTVALAAVASIAWIAPLVVASLLGSAAPARGVVPAETAPASVFAPTHELPGAREARRASGDSAGARRPRVVNAVASGVGAASAPLRRGASGELLRFMAPGRFEYFPMVRRLAARHAVELRLVMAIIASESGGDPAALSPSGAIGLMQLMPDTAAELGVDPWDPEQNVDGAVRYLSALISSYRSVDLTLIAYNAGPGFADRYRRGGVELGAETRAFLIRVGRMLE